MTINQCPRCKSIEYTQMSSYKQCNNCKNEFDCRVTCTPSEKKRLDLLNHRPKAFKSRKRKIKISTEQIKVVKRMLATNTSKTSIMNDLHLSEYHVTGVERGQYDHCLNKDTIKQLKEEGVMDFSWPRSYINPITAEQYQKGKELQAAGITNWIIEHQTGLTNHKQNLLRLGVYDKMHDAEL